MLNRISQISTEQFDEFLRKSHQKYIQPIEFLRKKSYAPPPQCSIIIQSSSYYISQWIELKFSKQSHYYLHKQIQINVFFSLFLTEISF